ncbi:uncharacterized protein LOC106159379 isoform X2 [Lingula anatina]|uniref:adenylate cyclase n=1 Tax=Lingula anatina TaxID=7574 RepID=A0A1S3HYK8_LINAN|nr:uncharacterized protein LOC106159379 isoform X1 [Lingula anatina]XP_013391107.1 uncharacterized protein LOC106159379 isoform X2 [Lingula anatina]|eukprot:XP_013391106.1 uncharacterized protein LOC106159379 isoform X1 [Lingula anatina]
MERDSYLKEHNIETFFIVAKHPRRQHSIVHRKGQLGDIKPRKLSFKSVSNCVLRLMRYIKFRAEIPFSNVLSAQHDDHKISMGSIADKLRRPIMNKRHSPESSHNRVNRYLKQAIFARSMEREKSEHVNFFTLRFRKPEKERQYQLMKDVSFGTSLLCALIVLVCVSAVQLILLPRTLMLLLLFLLTFMWLSILLILILGAKLKCIPFDLRQKPRARLAVIIVSIILIYAAAQVNIFFCEGGIHTGELQRSIISAADDHLHCELPPYFYLAAMMCFLTVALFLNLSALVKFAMLLIMVATFSIVMHFTHVSIFHQYDDDTGQYIPTNVVGVIVLIHFALALFVHGRQDEWTHRMDYLWKTQATEEKIEMTELQNNNRRILCNLLPAHVAAHFLDKKYTSNMELYSQQYAKVGVMFASIPNFAGFYMELDANNQGIECLRVLNEIIFDFDECLHNPQFYAVDKIKTIGSTYMAAVGLMPDSIIQDTEESVTANLTILVEFIFDLKHKLKVINENSYNNFMLKVGVNVGPVVAGVIGAKKPQFDIWGNTVNVASRMESTGEMDHIQVTEDIFQALKNHYDFKTRGAINVKGKGIMTTYFLLGRKDDGILNTSPPGGSTPVMPVGLPTPPVTPTGNPLLSRFRNRDGKKQDRPPSVESKQSLQSLLRSKAHALQSHSRPSSFHEVANYQSSTPLLSEVIKESPSVSAKLPNHGATPATSPPVESVSGNPPSSPPSTGSLSKRRLQAGVGSDSKENINKFRKSSGSSLPAPKPDTSRTTSPELPAYHFRNVKGNNMPQKEQFTPLTQSFILGRSGRNDYELAPQEEVPTDKVETNPEETSLLNTVDVSSGESDTEAQEAPVMAESVTRLHAVPLKASSSERLSSSGIINTHHPSEKIPTRDRSYPQLSLEAVKQHERHSSQSNSPTTPILAFIDGRNMSLQASSPSPKLFQPIPQEGRGGQQMDSPRFEGGRGSRNGGPCRDSPRGDWGGRGSRNDGGRGSRNEGGRGSRSSAPYRDSPRGGDGASGRASRATPYSRASPHIDTPGAGRLSMMNNGQRTSQESLDVVELPQVWQYPAERDSPGIPLPRTLQPHRPKPTKPQLQKQRSCPETAAGKLVPVVSSTEGTNATSKTPVIFPSNGAQRGGAPLVQGSSSQKREPKLRASPTDPLQSSSSSSPPTLPSPPKDLLYDYPSDGEKSDSDVQPFVTPNTVSHLTHHSSDADKSDSDGESSSHDYANLPPVRPPRPGAPLEPIYQGLPHGAAATGSNFPQGAVSGAPATENAPRDKKCRAQKGASGREAHKNRVGSPERPKPFFPAGVAAASSSSSSGATAAPPPLHAPPSFQVKRRGRVGLPPRHCRSLDYIPSDHESSAPSSPGLSPKLHHKLPSPSQVRAIFGDNAINLSLSSLNSSEMSRSDPAINYDSSSDAYISEYDNYRPGMASDEDYFVPEPISDMDIDFFDDIDIDSVTVSDTYSLDMPRPRNSNTGTSGSSGGNAISTNSKKQTDL